MKRTVLISALTLVVGIAIGVFGAQLLNAQQEPVKATDLLRADLVGMQGQEVIVSRGEFAPRASSGKHVHPGHEVIYVLEGSGSKEVEGEAQAPIRAGSLAYIPAGKVTETKNESATAPLKLVVFRVHPKGQPIVAKRVTEAYFQK
jgi:quercetin dioxygenase-like cupin family protein